MEKHDAYDEKLLVSRLRLGDENALRPLYDRYVKTLHYFIIRTAKSKELAEDVVHDVFIRIWDNRMKLDPEKSFKSFLFTTAKHHLLNLLDRIQHESGILEEISHYAVSAETITDMQLDFAESKALLEEAIDKLPEKCRQVFVRCKMDGLSYREAALELGITEGTVNSQIVKALASIREYMTLKNTILLLVLFFENF